MGILRGDHPFSPVTVRGDYSKVAKGVRFDIPSDNELRVASQRTQQCTVTLKQ